MTTAREQGERDIAFGRWRLQPARRRLLRDGEPVALGSRAFDVLLALAEARGALVTKDALLARVWPGVVVEENNLQVQVSALRRALGEDAAALIATVPGKGYCLTAPSEAPLAPPLAPLPVPPSGRPMVVVQPFESLAEDRGEDYFAAGLTADLVTDLARFEALQVVAPRSRDWAAEAALPNGPRGGSAKRYLVGGSVRRAGGRIRVTARLEDLATGVHLWADRFDRPLDDLFAVQEELADRIAARLVSQLDQEGMRQARQRPPASLDAYDLCLRGRELHGRVTEAATLEARAMFDRAIALDPDYGLAHSWQAFTVHRGYTHWWGEPRGFAAVPPALALAERGVALAPESPFCVSTLGYVQYLAGAWEDAIANARAAVRINPAAYQARQTLSEVLMHACVDPEEAVRQSRIALDLDPFHPPSAQAQLGRALLLAGRVEEALAELRRCGPRLRDYGPYYTNLVVAAVETGRLEEARAAVAEVRRLRPGWTLRDMAGRWLFRDPAVAERFRAAYRAAGLPEE